MQNPYAQAYAQTQVLVDSNEKMIEMLYEGAMRFLVRAKRAIDETDIEGRSNNIRKTIAIFVELVNILDHEKGGQVAAYLDGLYSHQIQTLSMVNITQDKEKIDEVLRVLRGLLEAWREVTMGEGGAGGGAATTGGAGATPSPTASNAATSNAPNTNDAPANI